MKVKHVTESRRFVLLGLLLLLLGAGLLLVCKLSVSEAIGSASALVGGAVVLLGNGLIIYGLLVFAGAENRSRATDEQRERTGQD